MRVSENIWLRICVDPCEIVVSFTACSDVSVWGGGRDEGNRALKIVKFTLNLNLHLIQATVTLNVIDACQDAHVPKGALL